MKFFLIFLLTLLKLCYSNDFKCVHFNDLQKSVEFYCENFNGTLPENCTTTALYTIGYNDKSKVTHLRIGGCDQETIEQLVNNYKFIHSLDISSSSLRSLKPFDIKLQHLRKLNASHNELTQNPKDFCWKMPRLEAVDFSFNNLNNVWGLPLSLTNINLSHNNITKIGRYDLSFLPNLISVDLSHNKIEKIDHDEIFSSSRILIQLRLEENRYEKFEKKFLHLIRNGVAIHFSWKYVTDFKIEAKIGKPIHVILNSQKEGVWPSSDEDHIDFYCNDGSFDNIRSFKFTNNHIQNPGDLLRCLTPSLERLTLVGSFDEKLSSTSLESFTNLWELIISGAQTMEFDFGSIKKPEKCHTLDISGNHLKEVGNTSLLERFPHISQFNVADNQIKNAPKIIQHFRASIARLHLNGNYVGKLNISTFQNVDLLELYLKNTNLSFDDVMPFEPLVKLKTLDISFNNLGKTNFSVPSTAFKNLSYFSAAHCNITNASKLIELLGSPIRNLDLSANYIGQLNATTFESFTSLQTLNLSGTKLIEIDFGIFQHTHYLYEVDASFNELKRIRVTSTAKHLGILRLDDNELTEVDAFTITNFPSLWKVSISKNRIPCAALAQLGRDWPNLNFINNPFDQKHGDCSNVVGLVNKLGFVGTFISKWF